MFVKQLPTAPSETMFISRLRVKAACLAATKYSFVIKGFAARDTRACAHGVFERLIGMPRRTFVVAVGSVGEEIEELVHRGVRAILHLANEEKKNEGKIT